MSDHTEVYLITAFYRLLSEEMIVDFFFFPSPKLSLSQVPLVAACSPSGISEVDVNQIEGAVQDLNLTSATEPADFGNQI